MLGAIIGDMVGYAYEGWTTKPKEVEFFHSLARMSDDSYLTIAVAEALLSHYPIRYDAKSIRLLQDELTMRFAKAWEGHREVGFGQLFGDWAKRALWGQAKPYHSYGNGSAMRVSPVGWMAKSEEEVKTLSKIVSEITHDHPEGLKGAETVAMAIYMALHGSSKEEIKARMISYYPEIDTLYFDDLVANYEFSPTCQGSVPQAIYCFLISTSLEDAIARCVRIGGDCDTTAAMAGSIAEAYYQKDNVSEFEEKFLYFMVDPYVEKLVKRFHQTIGSKKFE